VLGDDVVRLLVAAIHQFLYLSINLSRHLFRILAPTISAGATNTIAVAS
jgi:hypothetical protein